MLEAGRLPRALSTFPLRFPSRSEASGEIIARWRNAPDCRQHQAWKVLQPQPRYPSSRQTLTKINYVICYVNVKFVRNQ